MVVYVSGGNDRTITECFSFDDFSLLASSDETLLPFLLVCNEASRHDTEWTFNGTLWHFWWFFCSGNAIDSHVTGMEVIREVVWSELPFYFLVIFINFPRLTKTRFRRYGRWDKFLGLFCRIKPCCGQFVCLSLRSRTPPPPFFTWGVQNLQHPKPKARR